MHVSVSVLCFSYLLCEAKAVLKWRRWPAVLVAQEDALTPNGHRKVPDVRIQLFAVMTQFFRIPHLRAEEEKKRRSKKRLSVVLCILRHFFDSQVLLVTC